MLMPDQIATLAGRLQNASPAAPDGAAKLHADLTLRINGEQHHLTAMT